MALLGLENSGYKHGIAGFAQHVEMIAPIVFFCVCPHALIDELIKGCTCFYLGFDL